MRAIPATILAVACLTAGIAGVIVTRELLAGPAPGPLATLSACAAASPARQACLNAAFSGVLAEHGPEELFAAYDQLRRQDPTVAYNCHEAGHRAGAQYFRQSLDVVDALDYVGGSCQSAFTHGVFDAWVDSGNVDDAGLAAAAAVCDTAADYHSRFLCFDGLGHVVYQTSATFEEAFSRCALSSFLDGLEGRASGILMQKWAPVLPEDANPSASLDDIVRLCHRLTGRWDASASRPAGSPVGDATWASACRRTANYPFSTVLGDLGEVTQESVARYVALCLSAADTTPQGRLDSDFCIETAGFPFLYQAGMNPTKAARLCGLLPERNVRGCLVYLMKSDIEDGAATRPNLASLESAAAAL